MRTIQDEFGKFKWITPYAVEPDATARTVFIASMMHATHAASSVEREDQMSRVLPTYKDNERRKEVVHHEEVPGHPKPKKKNSSDKIVELRHQSQEYSWNSKDSGCVDWVSEGEMVVVHLQTDREFPSRIW